MYQHVYYQDPGADAARPALALCRQPPPDGGRGDPAAARGHAVREFGPGPRPTLDWNSREEPGTRLLHGVQDPEPDGCPRDRRVAGARLRRADAPDPRRPHREGCRG